LLTAGNVRLYRTLTDLDPDLRHGAISIGNFDGVHRGHARLMERLLRLATLSGGAATVFTFDPHPVQVLRPETAPPPLTWAERKADLLAELGVSAMIAYPTDEQLLSLPPREFFQRIVVEHLAARAIVEGPNFRFGRDRTGDVELLGRLCQEAGITLEVVSPLVSEGAYISSSRIRECIAAGDISAARGMLTRPYRVRGLVRHGARRGGSIGFPTANLDGVDTLLPGEGVYAARALTAQGCWPAAVNLGPNPTFREQGLKFETHLIGFQGNLYGQPLEVDFLARLRDIQPFGSVEELKSQLRRDVEHARAAVERWAGGGSAAEGKIHGD
jgi:riboflavin kinase/FMN adenylyltransferase